MENKTPLYKKPWFIVLIVAMAGFAILGNVLKSQAPQKVEKAYEQLSTTDQEAKLNELISKNGYAYETDLRKVVESQLKNPGDADFENMSFAIDQIPTRQLLATGFVTATNSFGAKIKTPFRCRFKLLDDNGKIEILNLDIQ